jgi:hypothetical protein
VRAVDSGSLSSGCGASSPTCPRASAAAGKDKRRSERTDQERTNRGRWRRRRLRGREDLGGEHDRDSGGRGREGAEHGDVTNLLAVKSAQRVLRPRTSHDRPQEKDLQRRRSGSAAVLEPDGAPPEVANGREKSERMAEVDLRPGAEAAAVAEVDLSPLPSMAWGGWWGGDSRPLLVGDAMGRIRGHPLMASIVGRRFP